MTCHQSASNQCRCSSAISITLCFCQNLTSIFMVAMARYVNMCSHKCGHHMKGAPSLWLLQNKWIRLKRNQVNRDQSKQQTYLNFLPDKTPISLNHKAKVKVTSLGVGLQEIKLMHVPGDFVVLRQRVRVGRVQVRLCTYAGNQS